MRRLLATGIVALISGCNGTSPQALQTNQATVDTTQRERSQKEQILDAVLQDVLTNERLEDTREFYGTAGDMKVALVSNRVYGERWPAKYRPDLPGWTVTRVEEGDERDRNKPRLLGIRIDKFSEEEAEQAGLFDDPIAVTVMNAGGDWNGDEIGAIIGGCSVYYNPKRVDSEWIVEFGGAMDP
jgi:hypothetical protein